MRTSTACQGKTLPDGVIVDCARRVSGPHPMDEDDWWLHLYVMLSRATALDNVLLLRPPDADVLFRGPPADLRARLAVFDRRVRSTRVRAEKVGREWFQRCDVPCGQRAFFNFALTFAASRVFLVHAQGVCASRPVQHFLAGSAAPLICQQGVSCFPLLKPFDKVCRVLGFDAFLR